MLRKLGALLASALAINFLLPINSAHAEEATVTCSESTARAHAPTAVPLPRIDTSSIPTSITFHTNCGDVVINTESIKAPITLLSIAQLSSNGFYDNSFCHRLLTAGIFILQCGDPTATGSGRAPWNIPDENLPKAGPNNYPEGTVGMANSGPNTNGSQFFFVYADSEITPAYPIWGHVVSGLAILKYVASQGVRGGRTEGAPLVPFSINSVELGFIPIDTSTSTSIPEPTPTPNAPLGPLVPDLKVGALLQDGFNVLISNYDPSFSWSFSSDIGRIKFDEINKKVYVVGLEAGQTATLSVTAIKFGIEPRTSIISKLFVLTASQEAEVKAAAEAAAEAAAKAASAKALADQINEKQAALDKENAVKAAAGAAESSQNNLQDSLNNLPTRVKNVQSLLKRLATQIKYLASAYPAQSVSVKPYLEKIAATTLIDSSNLISIENFAKELQSQVTTLDKAVGKIKTYIYCTKGKKSSRVSGIKPACPPGYSIKIGN